MFGSKKSSDSGKSGSAPKPSKSGTAPLSARDRALAIKKAQEEVLVRLPIDRLYIVMWIRDDPPQPNDFHWGYYHHKSPYTGGTKYHFKNLGSGWMADHGPTGGVFKSKFLCVLVQIAEIPANKENILSQVMRTYDTSWSSIPGMSFRVWLFRIMALLIQHGLVRCDNIPALEQECKDIGNQHRGDAAGNRQPRPVRVARTCS